MKSETHWSFHPTVDARWRLLDCAVESPLTAVIRDGTMASNHGSNSQGQGNVSMNIPVLFDRNLGRLATRRWRYPRPTVTRSQNHDTTTDYTTTREQYDFESRSHWRLVIKWCKATTMNKSKLNNVQTLMRPEPPNQPHSSLNLSIVKN